MQDDYNDVCDDDENDVNVWWFKKDNELVLKKIMNWLFTKLTPSEKCSFGHLLVPVALILTLRMEYFSSAKKNLFCPTEKFVVPFLER